METKANDTNTDLRDSELGEELAGILAAISVVSKRLARKLFALQRQGTPEGEGGKSDGQDG